MSGDLATLPQRTLAKTVGCCGIGLHSGQVAEMTLSPAEPDAGIVFRRRDIGAEIRAHWTNVVDSPLCTVLSNQRGETVGTVEHLMAALCGTGIDNALVELDGPEVPIMDGSAGPFVLLVERAGQLVQRAARQAVTVRKPVVCRQDGAMAALFPADGFSMSFEIEFDNPLIRRQDIHLAFAADTFKDELAWARTFGLVDDVERLWAAGLARGGSLDNAVVVSGEHVLNRGGLRYRDEFVRHKLVDAVGDLYLAGAPIIGHFRGVRSGHAHTRRLLAALFADADAWCRTPLVDPDWREERHLVCA